MARNFAIGSVLTVFLVGANLLLLFIVLSGGVNHYPFNRFYWVQGDTSGISGAPATARYTFWGLCSGVHLALRNCSVEAAYPISPVDNFNTETGVPLKFVNDRDTFYYLTRVAFGLYLAGFGFAFSAAFAAVLLTCLRTFNTTTSVFGFFAFFIILAATCLQTAATALAKKAFKDAGLYSKISATNLGLSWGATVCLLVVFLAAGCSGLKRTYGEHQKWLNQQKAARGELPAQAPADVELEDQSSFVRTGPAEQAQTGGFGGMNFFTRSRKDKSEETDSTA